MRQIGDDLVHAAVRRKVQDAPVDCDFSRADAEEAAEIDDGGPHQPGMVDHDVDDTPHVVAAGALHRFAKKRVSRLAFDDDRGCLGVAGRRGGRGRRLGG
ncbi:MAG TPA: hypothetical protein VM639_15525 [Dongiaceae bacterium]|nr:hypothetical protein [Dongiaceae bacterium]